MRRRSIAWAGLVVAACLPGCAEPPLGPVPAAPAWATSGADRVGDAASRVPSPAALAAVTVANKRYKVALMTGADGSPDNAPLIAAFKTTASRIGVTPQLLAPGRGIDAGAAIRTAFAGAADAVCIVVGSDADRESARQAAMSIRRPVIAIEDRLEGSPVRDALRDAFSGIVGPDAVTAGRMAGQALLPLWGHAQVAVLAATDADFARASGFSSSVSGALAVVATLRVRADGGDVAAQVGKLIQRYPHIGALFCTNVDAAKGALGAIAAAGLTRKVAIVVAGSTSELRARRAAGDIVILIDRRPDLIGRQAAELAVGLLDGRFDPHEEVVTTQQIVR